MKEEKVIRKWFWVWNFEKEERWLNTMSLRACRDFSVLPSLPDRYQITSR